MKTTLAFAIIIAITLCANMFVFTPPAYALDPDPSLDPSQDIDLDKLDDVDLDQLTPHYTKIDHGMDKALIGKWRLIRAQLEMPGTSKKIAFPAAGRLLTILDSGSFEENFTTETNAPKPSDIASGDYITTTRRSPKNTCKIKATGKIIGHLTARLALKPEKLQAPLIHISLSKAASTKPKVWCKGYEKSLGNMVTTPLGYGRTVGIGTDNPYVPYHYKISAPKNKPASKTKVTITSSWHHMEVWSVSAKPRIRYFYQRVY